MQKGCYLFIITRNVDCFVLRVILAPDPVKANLGTDSVVSFNGLPYVIALGSSIDFNRYREIESPIGLRCLEYVIVKNSQTVQSTSCQSLSSATAALDYSCILNLIILNDC